MAIMQIPGHDHQKPREVTLEEIRAVLGDCHLCPLGETRTNLVFGVGRKETMRVACDTGSPCGVKNQEKDRNLLSIRCIICQMLNSVALLGAFAVVPFVHRADQVAGNSPDAVKR